MAKLRNVSRFEVSIIGFSLPGMSGRMKPVRHAQAFHAFKHILLEQGLQALPGQAACLLAAPERCPDWFFAFLCAGTVGIHVASLHAHVDFQFVG